MTLLSNEQQISTSFDQFIILTTHRIQKVVKDMSSHSSVTIFLEDISSIEARFDNNTVLLILAGISGLASGYFFLSNEQSTQGAGIAALIAGIVLLIAWFASRQYLIKISSNGGSPLILNVTNLKKQTADELVDLIAHTKANRINQLYKLE